MRKIACWCLLMVMMIAAGCSKKASENEAVDGSWKAPDSSSSLTFQKADMDFTKMNYNMISGQLFKVLVNSQKYLGKTIRFKGQYFSTSEEALGVTMHSVLIYDATACCQTGLQFELKQKPGEDVVKYPNPSQTIEIFGKLCYKDINGMDYYFVECDQFIPID